MGTSFDVWRGPADGRTVAIVRARTPPLLLVLTAISMLGIAAFAPPAGAAKKKPKPPTLRTTVATPKAGDVTLARRVIQLTARKGRTLPKKILVKATVTNAKKFPRSVDAFFTAVRLKAKRKATDKTRALFMTLIAVTRRKSATSAGLPRPDPRIGVSYELGDDFRFGPKAAYILPLTDDFESPFGDLEDRPGSAPPPPPQEPLCIDTVANFDLFPELRSFEVGPLSSTLDAAASEPVAEVMAVRFNARQNLRYAFAAGCQIKTIPVPESWFSSRGLTNPTSGGGGGACTGSTSGVHLGANPEYGVSVGFACGGGRTFTAYELVFPKAPASTEPVSPGGASCQTSGASMTCTLPSPTTSAAAVANFPAEATCSGATGVQLFVTSAGARLGPFALTRNKGTGDCP
jgi:hypothetical protein